MTMNDPLANVYSHILNCEKKGKEFCIIKPISKLIKQNIKLLQDNGYIGPTKEIKNGMGDIIEIKLMGNINKCGVIKPRHAIKKNGFERFEKRFLPAKDFGFLIISTPKGIITHIEAKKHNIGGKLLAYCY